MSEEIKLVSSNSVYDVSVDTLRSILAKDLGVPVDAVKVDHVTIVRGRDDGPQWREFAGLKVIVDSTKAKQ